MLDGTQLDLEIVEFVSTGSRLPVWSNRHIMTVSWGVSFLLAITRFIFHLLPHSASISMTVSDFLPCH